MRKNLAQLIARDCTISALDRQQNQFTWTIACAVNGATVRMTSVVTVEGPNAYREELTSQWRDQNTKSVLTAHRLGDCSASEAAASRASAPR